jgi:hypothetical protein
MSTLLQEKELLVPAGYIESQSRSRHYDKEKYACFYQESKNGHLSRRLYKLPMHTDLYVDRVHQIRNYRVLTNLQ